MAEAHAVEAREGGGAVGDDAGAGEGGGEGEFDVFVEGPEEFGGGFGAAVYSVCEVLGEALAAYLVEGRGVAAVMVIFRKVRFYFFY